MLENFFHYSVATQVFYGIVVLAIFVNGYMAAAADIKPHWRFVFGYISTVLFLYVFYIGLRLAEVFDQRDFAKLVNWLFPFMALCLILPALLIYWEKTFFRKALERINPEA